MRLPDIYYTSQPLDGSPAVAGIPEPPTFYQGDDIVFEVFLNIDGNPVLDSEYTISVVVKQTIYDIVPIWEGTINDGVYKKDVPGYYKLIIPSCITSVQFAGTYWLAVQASQKIGESNDIRDLTRTIMQKPFYLAYAATSPNANTLSRWMLEQTVPKSLDARHE